MQSKRRFGTLSARLAVLGLLVVCGMGLLVRGDSWGARPLHKVSLSGRALGTSYHFVVLVPSAKKQRAKQALQGAVALVRRMKQRFSEWEPTSEISRINREAYRRAVPLSRPMLGLLRGALHVGRVTGGAFSIGWASYGPVWKRAASRQKIPTARDMKPFRKAAHPANILLRRGTIRFRRPQTKIGIAGVAKGWIIDAVFHHLVRAGFRHILVNIGGDLRTSGRNQQGKKRALFVADPFHARRFVGVIRVADVAIATSGNYLRFRRIAGKKWGHILDPRTGFPPAFQGSATVLTYDASMADALATAMFVLGPKQGLALAKRTPGLEVIFCSRTGLQTSLPSIKRIKYTRATTRPGRRR